MQPKFCTKFYTIQFRVFIKHFESKGTMVDLDSKRLAAYFKEQFAKGRKLFKAEFKDAATV
jgi:hypothetical protein